MRKCLAFLGHLVRDVLTVQTAVCLLNIFLMLIKLCIIKLTNKFKISHRYRDSGSNWPKITSLPRFVLRQERGDTRTQINGVPGSASVCCSLTVELHSGVGQGSTAHSCTQQFELRSVHACKSLLRLVHLVCQLHAPSLLPLVYHDV